MTGRALLLTVCALAATPAAAQVRGAAPQARGPAALSVELPVWVHASVDRTAIWVGDRITFSVDVVCSGGVELLLDDVAKEKLRVNGLDVVSSDVTTTGDGSGRTTYRLAYVLTTYRVDSPSLSIEPLSARYYQRLPGQRLQDIAPAGEVTIPGAVVAFRSTLPEQASYELRDGRAPAQRHPLAARAGPAGLALVVVSIVPAGFVAAALLRGRTRKIGRPSVRQTRIDRRATLERLRALDVSTVDERRRAYDAISEAIRDHVATTSNLPARGMTGAELGEGLERSGRTSSREVVTTLLSACDQARYGPPQALPDAQACREALAAAEQVLAGR